MAEKLSIRHSYFNVKSRQMRKCNKALNEIVVAAKDYPAPNLNLIERLLRFTTWLVESKKVLFGQGFLHQISPKMFATY